MKHPYSISLLTGLLALVILLPVSDSAADDIVRPEEIQSKRLVVYDDATYVKLARQWKEYNGKFPSEYAYANWMYAARYASDENYSKLLAKGVKKYPANPTLLYLKALEHHGMTQNAEGRAYLERAIALDSKFVDPWFVLVTHYMDARDDGQLDVALRHLLESGYISDDVMDYNYNLLACMDANGILITNGDNDTYPGWILTRIVKYRPDLAIVNRSLLNTTWYPVCLIEKGLPRFIASNEVESFRSSILKEMKDKKTLMGPGGPFGDTLMVRLVEAAARAGRPVYLSHTLYESPTVKRLKESGRNLGLLTLVTPTTELYGSQLRNLFARWLSDFRTGGLDSWRLRAAPETDAGRMILQNYAGGLAMLLDSLRAYAPELRGPLFEWYRAHAAAMLRTEMRDQIDQAWCAENDVKEIQMWCQEQGRTK
ncbi:hypothetical protein KKH27_12735 [bacterium]|nr:hypothetical protein [bacterium]MBU1985350.1 hypothetical protein [bacterium]